MGHLLHAGAMLARNALLMPDKVGARDFDRSITFREWNRRACRLANALIGLGLEKGDRVAILGYNCVEWMEIYAGLAKAGLVAVPLNFRLVAREIRYILENCGARALIVQDALVGPVEEIRDRARHPARRFIVFGDAERAGYQGYEALLERAVTASQRCRFQARTSRCCSTPPAPRERPRAPCAATSPRSIVSILVGLGFGFTPDDVALLVMPLCHANSLWFGQSVTALGGTALIYSRPSFDPELLLRLFANERVSFTSLVPTHYIMMLGLPEATLARYDVSGVKRLLISSAPARLDTKRAILDHFRNTGLFEAYGSTEAGWVTLLRPEQQFDKLGSIGREWPGTNAVRLLDPAGEPVAPGAIGELYFNTPAAFQRLLEPAGEDRGGISRRLGHGRRHGAPGRGWLLLSRGPQGELDHQRRRERLSFEVENVLGGHEQVKDVAVIGIPHPVWGEAVHAVVVPNDGAHVDADDLLAFARTHSPATSCRGRSRSSPKEMPRTATGKIQHRLLRDRFAPRPAASEAEMG